MSSHWVEVYISNNMGEAEVLKGLLEASEIKVWNNQEGAAQALGLISTTMGMIHIMVPDDQVEEAMEILDDYIRGVYEEGEEG
ncbi:MAG: DUF2007 domain-containing protein [Anaerolineales bacterium]|nr:DUF2007 domain-containing protein [Anaerolineales bacterium]